MLIAGLDLGGTSVKGVMVRADGVEAARHTVSFDLEAPLAFAGAVEACLAQLERAAGSRADRIGLSAPGLAAADRRSIAFMPGRFPGLEGLDWGAHLARGPVPVLNDAQAALLGEVWRGAAAGCRNVILLTLGTGVGGAAMVDGQLLRGHTGKAGHLGHVSLNPEGALDITGTPGSLEDAVGNHNIRERSGGRFDTTHALIEAHLQGDPAATAVWNASLRALAAAIVSFTNVLDPEVVVLGGGISRCGSALFDPLQAMVARCEWRVCGHQVRIIPAMLGEYAGANGAAACALGLGGA